MKKNTLTVFLLLSALCARAVSAALPEGDLVFAAMKDELTRSMAKLDMDKLGRPCFLSYHVADGHYFRVAASFGGVDESFSVDYRQVKADLRVGSYGLDNSHYAPDVFSGYRADPDFGVALEDNYDSLRFSLWSATDRAYKKALETYSKKKAFIESKNMTELYADISAQEPAELFRPVAAERVDEAAWRENVRRVSEVFLRYPQVRYSAVQFSFGSGGVRFLNSEGSAYRQPACDGSVTIEAHGYAPDGFPLKAVHSESFCLAKDAPSVDNLLAKAEELGGDMAKMGKSERIKAYIGPVLFEGPAAARFFDNLLVRGAANPREVWTEKSRWSADTVFRRAGELVERLGMRVTSPFLNVVDDPSARYSEGRPLAGFYEADDEGVPARRISLVTKGKLSEYFMSRAATRDFKKSNGHGRASFSDYPAGAPANVFIVPEENPARVMPLAELKKKFIEICKEQELEYCIRVKGIEGMYSPFSAWRVYLDGREEPVHGVEFTGVNLRALRDIAAVSRETSVHDLAWGVNASIVTPALLVQEMEIKKSEDKPEKKPYLPHPYFGK